MSVEDTEYNSRRISQINDTIRKQDTAESSSLNSLYAQLDAARVEYRSFQDALYVTHPELRTRSGQTASLSPADLDTLTADGDTAYLEYVVAEDHVILFVSAKDKSSDATGVKIYSISI